MKVSSAEIFVWLSWVRFLLLIQKINSDDDEPLTRQRFRKIFYDRRLSPQSAVSVYIVAVSHFSPSGRQRKGDAFALNRRPSVSFHRSDSYSTISCLGERLRGLLLESRVAAISGFPPMSQSDVEQITRQDSQRATHRGQIHFLTWARCANRHGVRTRRLQIISRERALCVACSDSVLKLWAGWLTWLWQTECLCRQGSRWIAATG